jgi:hypothetical protein
MKSKAGKTFDASLVLKDGSFTFEFDKSKKVALNLKR